MHTVCPVPVPSLRHQLCVRTNRPTWKWEPPVNLEIGWSRPFIAPPSAVYPASASGERSVGKSHVGSGVLSPPGRQGQGVPGLRGVLRTATRPARSGRGCEVWPQGRMCPGAPLKSRPPPPRPPPWAPRAGVGKADVTLLLCPRPERSRVLELSCSHASVSSTGRHFQ